MTATTRYYALLKRLFPDRPPRLNGEGLTDQALSEDERALVRRHLSEVITCDDLLSLHLEQLAFRFGITPRRPAGALAPERVQAAAAAGGVEVLDWPELLQLGFDPTALRTLRHAHATATSTEDDAPAGSADETLVERTGRLADPAPAHLDGQWVTWGVRQGVYRLLTGPDREWLLPGLFAFDATARRELAVRVAKDQWGPQINSHTAMRRHYAAAAAVLRELLLGWARARGNGPTPPTLLVELADGRCLEVPRTDDSPACGWAEANTLYEGVAAADPAAAEAFALVLYVGMGEGSAAALTGLDSVSVGRVCRPLLDKLKPREAAVC